MEGSERYIVTDGCMFLNNYPTKMCLATPPPPPPIKTKTHYILFFQRFLFTRGQIAMTAVMTLAAFSALASITTVGAVLYMIVFLFITFICPAWLISLQPYKKSVLLLPVGPCLLSSAAPWFILFPWREGDGEVGVGQRGSHGWGRGEIERETWVG